MILPTGPTIAVADNETAPQIGDRITGRSAPPDDGAVRDWIGPEAFKHWAGLRNWIEGFYPGVFAPDWLEHLRQSLWLGDIAPDVVDGGNLARHIADPKVPERRPVISPSWDAPCVTA